MCKQPGTRKVFIQKPAWEVNNMNFEVGQTVSIDWEKFLRYSSRHPVAGQSGILVKIDPECSTPGHHKGVPYQILFQNGQLFWASTAYVIPYVRRQT